MYRKNVFSFFFSHSKTSELVKFRFIESRKETGTKILVSKVLSCFTCFSRIYSFFLVVIIIIFFFIAKHLLMEQKKKNLAQKQKYKISFLPWTHFRYSNSNSTVNYTINLKWWAWRMFKNSFRHHVPQFVFFLFVN